MKNKLLLALFLLHFGLSLGGFVGLYGWAAGGQDAGVGSAPPGWLEGVLRYLVLQPLAHWVLDALAIAWWTWPGLGGLALLLAVNSAVVVATAAVLARRSGSGA